MVGLQVAPGEVVIVRVASALGATVAGSAVIVTVKAGGGAVGAAVAGLTVGGAVGAAVAGLPVGAAVFAGVEVGTEVAFAELFAVVAADLVG